MHRTTRSFVGPLLSLAVLASCRDRVVSPMDAPETSAPAVPAPLRFAPSERPSLQLGAVLADSTAVDFALGPSGGVFHIGGHAVYFPPQSVCNPATSSYGPTTWDAPCALLPAPIHVHAEVRRRDGRSWIDFTPSLRFVPSSHPSRWVWMFMRTPEAVGATGDLTRFNILWTRAIGDAGVDETSSDPTMRTYVDTWMGVSMRRIKHFSGYTATAGRECQAGTEGCP